MLLSSSPGPSKLQLADFHLDSFSSFKVLLQFFLRGPLFRAHPKEGSNLPRTSPPLQLQVPVVGLTKSGGFAKVCLQAEAAVCFAYIPVLLCKAMLVVWVFS